MVENAQHAKQLLGWYDQHARELPWRIAPGAAAPIRPDPYHIWLSEIMLQQTVVKAVIPYFETFLQQWPSVFEMAACEQEEVLKRWAGLGYYARARNLHACAREIVSKHDGRFPSGEKALLALPGIGPYTASAIRAIAFDQNATVVDGNVERVVARLFALKKPLRDIKAVLKQKAGQLTPDKRPGDYAQAMMDLGATICTPASPKCSSCPLTSHCVAHRQDCAASLPVRAPKKPKPVRYGMAFLVLRSDGAVLLRQRSEKGLLAKMLEVPATSWCVKPSPNHQASVSDEEAAPVRADWHGVRGVVLHTFTHFHLQLEVKLARVGMDCAPLAGADPERCRWVLQADLAEQALPGIMRKIIAHGID